MRRRLWRSNFWCEGLRLPRKGKLVCAMRRECRSRANFIGVHQAALHALGSNQTGLTRVLVNLGPFGSSHAGSPGLYIWAVFSLALTALLATVVFARRDL